LTLLSTTTLSGSFTTISSISQSYKRLYIVINGVTCSSSGRFRIWPNASVTGDTSFSSFENTSSASNDNNYCIVAGFNNNVNGSGGGNAFTLLIDNYASTTKQKPFNMFGRFIDGSSVARNQLVFGGYKLTTAISSLGIDFDAGSLTGGTVLIYGVN
jgi:hypothetical protein